MSDRPDKPHDKTSDGDNTKLAPSVQHEVFNEMIAQSIAAQKQAQAEGKFNPSTVMQSQSAERSGEAKMADPSTAAGSTTGAKPAEIAAAGATPVGDPPKTGSGIGFPRTDVPLRDILSDVGGRAQAEIGRDITQMSNELFGVKTPAQVPDAGGVQPQRAGPFESLSRAFDAERQTSAETQKGLEGQKNEISDSMREIANRENSGRDIANQIAGRNPGELIAQTVAGDNGRIDSFAPREAPLAASLGDQIAARNGEQIGMRAGEPVHIPLEIKLPTDVFTGVTRGDEGKIGVEGQRPPRVSDTAGGALDGRNSPSNRADFLAEAADAASKAKQGNGVMEAAMTDAATRQGADLDGALKGQSGNSAIDRAMAGRGDKADESENKGNRLAAMAAKIAQTIADTFGASKKTEMPVEGGSDGALSGKSVGENVESGSEKDAKGTPGLIGRLISELANLLPFGKGRDSGDGGDGGDEGGDAKKAEEAADTQSEDDRQKKIQEEKRATYIVQDGDYLELVSTKLFANTRYTSLLVKLNPNMTIRRQYLGIYGTEVDMLKPGEEILLPTKQELQDFLRSANA